MLIKHIIFFILIVFSSNSFASLITLNQDKYLEINFSIQGNNGVFDSDINRFDLIFDYDPSVWSNCCFSERIDIYDGNTLLSSTGSGWYANDIFSFGNLDFTTIRNGSILGRIQIHAWSTTSHDDILLQDFFGWSLGKCDSAMTNCSFSENSWVSFDDIKVVSASVPEPSTNLLLFSSLLLLLKRRNSY